MKKFLILLTAIILSGCGGGDGTASSETTSSSTVKDLFSNWVFSSGSSFGEPLDLAGLEFDRLFSVTITITLDSNWITELNNRGLDSTGLVAETTRVCAYDLFISGDQISGRFYLQRNDDSDLPINNACLQWDSNCTTGTCNFNSDHTYIKGTTLTINPFGPGDVPVYFSGNYR